MLDKQRELNVKRQLLMVTWVGMVVNILLSAFKFAAGILGGSQAVVADAVHSISDMSTDIAIIIGVKYWTKPPDDDHPHGHKRIEIFITMAIGLALAAVGIGILWNALSTLRDNHDTPPRAIALIAALVSILTKEILYRWTVVVGRRIKSMPVIANAWHHRSDALSSIPVALAVAGTLVLPSDWAFLDHVGAVLVSLFILHAAYKIVLPGLSKLVDSAASPEEVTVISDIASKVPGVLKVNIVRSRYIGYTDLSVEIHVEVNSEISVREGHDICENVKNALIQSSLDITDVVVHVDPYFDAKVRE